MSLRVFLVEDNPMIRERLIESLTATGAIDVVGHADTEWQAVEALSDGSWDAVLLDLQLKQGTGLGVLRAIGPSRPLGAKIVVLTTYAIPPYRARRHPLFFLSPFNANTRFMSVSWARRCV